MISVEEARARVLDLVAPVDVEEVPLIEATGRVLAHSVPARRTQPPFDASAMDGYALRSSDLAVGAQLHVVGESAAGLGFSGDAAPGEAIRIFTGAPVPAWADHVIIQENVTRDGDTITLNDLGHGANIRPAGGDFSAGDLLDGPRRLTPADVALLAAMNIDRVPVRRRPVVALIATGDELVPPGETPGPDQIIASNSYGLHGLLAQAGAEPRMLPIAPDDLEAICTVFDLAHGADLVVTIGGASVGDRDLVGAAAERLGVERAFYKVAMRPGKPLMAGRLGDAAMIGLPGNPVSAMVCAEVFLRPVIDRLLGLPDAGEPTTSLPLTAPITANGPRRHYLRAQRVAGGVEPFPSQDSSLLTVLSRADCLIVRPPDDPERAVGDMVQVLTL